MLKPYIIYNSLSRHDKFATGAIDLECGTYDGFNLPTSIAEAINDLEGRGVTRPDSESIARLLSNHRTLELIPLTPIKSNRALDTSRALEHLRGFWGDRCSPDLWYCTIGSTNNNNILDWPE